MLCTPWEISPICICSGHLYAATVADFSGTDSLIIKDSLRTEQYDYKHLNGKILILKLSKNRNGRILILKLSKHLNGKILILKLSKHPNGKILKLKHSKNLNGKIVRFFERNV